MSLSQVRKRPAKSVACLVVGLLAVAGTWALIAVGQARAVAPRVGPIAGISKTVSLSETGYLHKISKNGASFVERGPATGTYTGSLTLYLTTTPDGVKFRMKGENQHGALLGGGAATIKSRGKIGKVSGSARFTSGTGRYEGAHGDDLTVTGTFNRENYRLVVTISGGLHF